MLRRPCRLLLEPRKAQRCWIRILGSLTLWTPYLHSSLPLKHKMAMRRIWQLQCERLQSQLVPFMWRPWPRLFFATVFNSKCRSSQAGSGCLRRWRFRGAAWWKSAGVLHARVCKNTLRGIPRVLLGFAARCCSVTCLLWTPSSLS